MAKYQGSRGGRAPTPQQATAAAIAQIDRQTARMVAALKQERDAAIANRELVSRGMVESQKIEAQQTELNAEIGLANQKAIIREQELIKQETMDRYNASTQAARDMFGAISKLSETAGTKLQELQKERYEKSWAEDLARIMVNKDDDPLAKAAREESLLQEISVTELDSQIAKSAAEGANPLDTSAAALNSDQLNPAVQSFKMIKAARTWGTWLMSRQTVYMLNGREFSVQEAANDPELMQAVISFELPNFLTEKGLKGINPGVLWNSGMLPKMLEQSQTIVNQAFTKKVDAQNDQVKAQAVDRLYSSKGEDQEKIRLSLKRIGMTDNQINELLDDAFIVQAQRQSPHMTWEQYAVNMGEARETKLALRYNQAIQAATDARNKNQAQRAKEYEEQALAIVRQRLSQAGTDEQKLGVINEAKKDWEEKFAGLPLPSSLQSLENSTNREIAQSELTSVSAATATDSLSMDLYRNLQTQEARQAFLRVWTTSRTSRYGENYEQVENSLSKKAQDLVGFKPTVAGQTSPEAVLMQGYLARDLRNRINRLSAPGATYANNMEGAVAAAVAEQDADIIKGKTDKNSPFYKNEKGEFVNINKSISASTRSTNARLTKLTNTVATRSGDPNFDVFKEDGLVLPDNELQAKITAFRNRTGNFDVGPEIRQLARIKNMTPFDAFTRLAVGQGMQDPGQELREAMNTLEYTDPETARQLDNIRLRTQVIVDRASATVTGTTSQYIRGPFAQLRALTDPHESYGGNYGAFNLGSADSTGQSPIGSGINENLVNLTLGELLDKGNRGQIFAAGRYQIIPGTLAGLMRNNPNKFPRSAKFSPDIQDQMFVELAKGRIRSTVEATMEGLRIEWVGLRNVPDSKLRPVVEALMRGDISNANFRDLINYA